MECLVEGLAEHFGVRFEPLTLGHGGGRGDSAHPGNGRYEDDTWTRGKVESAPSIDFLAFE